MGSIFPPLIFLHPYHVKVILHGLVCQIDHAALPTSEPRLAETKRPRHIHQNAQNTRQTEDERSTKSPRRAQQDNPERAGPKAGVCARTDKSSAALLNQSMCQRASSSERNIASSTAMLWAGRGADRDPTWLEHTLEIKDDQNKGSQTGGEYHPAYPAHPHQVTQSLFHAGLGGCCSVRWDALRCWTLRVSGGTEEDCRPVNEPNSSTAERTTVRTSGGGKSLGNTPLSGEDERAQMHACLQEHHRRKK